MKLFIWNDVNGATSSYHDNGGVVVVAKDLRRARKLIRDSSKECEALTLKPDLIRECEGPEYIAIHPNAGCC